MSPAAWSFVATLSLTLLGAVGWLIKWGLDRLGSPNTGSLTLSQAWETHSSAQERTIARMTSRVDDLERRETARDQREAEREAEVSRLSGQVAELGDRLATLRTHVRPLVDWLRRGAVPPPPVVAEELFRWVDEDYGPED